MLNSKRFNFVFNLNNSEHAEAYRILSGKPNRSCSSFIIRAILDSEKNEGLKETIIEAVKEAVRGLNIQADAPLQLKNPPNGDSDEQEGIPEEVLSYLDKL